VISVFSCIGLQDFKDYSYEAFISTSSTAVYYGGRHRFYTGDLTMSMPTYKSHNRAWVLKNYNDDGTHASTTVDGNKLKLANQGSTTTPSYVSGYWLSDPWDLSSITNVENSFIEYCACARNGADVTVKTAINYSSTTAPSANSFTIATTTTTIPNITAGDNLYGKYLWLKIEMTPSTSGTSTPCLCRINLAINNVGTTTSATSALQNLSYTYDAVGNITQVKDLSGFGGNKTVNYTYDDLYRLLTASTTVPAQNPYNLTYAYDRLGNITSSNLGTYTYAETGFANPNAATQIGSSALTYDNNGNVTDFGNDDHVWNYRDRLTKSVVGGVNTFYGYDYNNDRVTKGNGVATTTYANKYYTVASATTTKHVFDNQGTLLATIEGNGTATSTNFVHTDHLGGTDIVVDEDGDVVEETDYFPYGKQRVSTTNTGFKEQKKFTGYEFDQESNLSYAKNRYYDQNDGKYLSQDFVFQNIITDERGQIALQDPQLQNSYSYARNNPIKHTDTEGAFIDVIADIAFIANDVREIYNAQSNGQSTGLLYAALVADVVGAVVPGATGLGAGVRGLGKAIDSSSALTTRAKEIQGALKGLTKNKTTTAVTRSVDKDGNIVNVVSSSENKLRSEQRALLKDIEIEGIGKGHAEVTGVNFAKQQGLTPIETSASRPICSACAQTLKNENVKATSPLKK